MDSKNVAVDIIKNIFIFLNKKSDQKNMHKNFVLQKKIQNLFPLSFSFVKAFPKANLYLVGGALRDLLLLRPLKDLDFVVQNISPLSLEKWFKTRGTLCFIGTRFGVYQFKTQKKKTLSVDIAFPRTEKKQSTSQGGYREFIFDVNPSLLIEEDLCRRDFTINSMAYDLKQKKIIDPFDGMKDLQKKCIRAVGIPGERFEEDLSRMLRAIRFACELNFSVEKKTMKSIYTLAPRLQNKKHEHFIVPRETIGKEFLKGFFANPLHCLELYKKTGLLSILFQKTILAKENKKTLTYLCKKSSSLDVLLTSLFFWNKSEQLAANVMKTYHFSLFPKEDKRHICRETVHWLLKQAFFIEQNDPKTLSYCQYEALFFLERGKKLIDLLEGIACGMSEKKQKTLKQKIRWIKQQKNKISKNTHTLPGKNIPFLIDGNDVLKEYPIVSGPQIGEILNNIREEQLKGTIKTQRQALKWVREHANETNTEGANHDGPTIV